MLNVAAYLDRIRYAGATEPSVETLRALHRAHMLSVPFENLDIHLGRPIVCDEESFIRKIVSERRGGFCYELNGALAALLRALGFRVTLLSARVARADGSGDGPEYDHLALRVDVPETSALPGASSQADSWLADVGFGDNFLEPLRFEPGLEQSQIGRVYRLVEIDGRFNMEVRIGETWKRQYSFAMEPRQLSEFAAMCRYHQTSAASHFTQQRLCSIATAQGRITLSDSRLIETRGSQREEREVVEGPQRRATLRELFGVELPGAP